MNAVAGCGLQLYRFGQAVSIVFFTQTWRPDSFYDRIKENAQLGLHTLLLLDIRVKEPSVEALCRGKKEYEPPRFMTCATCARQLMEVEEARGEKIVTMMIASACSSSCVCFELSTLIILRCSRLARSLF